MQDHPSIPLLIHYRLLLLLVIRVHVIPLTCLRSILMTLHDRHDATGQRLIVARRDQIMFVHVVFFRMTSMENANNLIVVAVKEIWATQHD
jgi:hypothetical protein